MTSVEKKGREQQVRARRQQVDGKIRKKINIYLAPMAKKFYMAVTWVQALVLQPNTKMI